jgi:hypothetical protein
VVIKLTIVANTFTLPLVLVPHVLHVPQENSTLRRRVVRVESSGGRVVKVAMAHWGVVEARASTLGEVRVKAGTTPTQAVTSAALG